MLRSRFPTCPEFFLGAPHNARYTGAKPHSPLFRFLFVPLFSPSLEERSSGSTNQGESSRKIGPRKAKATPTTLPLSRIITGKRAQTSKEKHRIHAGNLEHHDHRKTARDALDANTRYDFVVTSSPRLYTERPQSSFSKTKHSQVQRAEKKIRIGQK